MSLFVVTDAIVMSGRGEGVPGEVKPGGTGEELVGEVVVAEEVDKALKLLRIFGTDVSGLAEKVLGIADSADLAIDSLVSKARIDDDGSDFKASWL